MSGLRQWTRDPGLPARAGQPELTPPDEAAIGELVARHALVEGAAPPSEIHWDYARWKPGVSITCMYRLVWSDGHEQVLVAKRYTGDKVEHLIGRKEKPEEWQPFSPRVQPRVLLPEESLALWCPAGDRELPGVPFLLNVKRFASLMKHSGLVEPGLIRRRKSEYELLRYKAERRAVFRAKLKLRDEAKTKITLAVRVLPIDEGLRIAAARGALEKVFCGAEPFVPRLLGVHDRYGILIEEWLDVRESHESGDFAHAREAGALLARLHALAPPPTGADGPVTELQVGTGANLKPLFAIDEALSSRYRGLHEPASPRRTWVHGDFHPDQVATVKKDGVESTALMDLDCLAAGDPTSDLASWIADHLFEDDDADYATASSALVEGYAEAGGTVDGAHLARFASDELVRRGAAAIRRLESGGIERAARCLERAAAIG